MAGSSTSKTSNGSASSSDVSMDDLTKQIEVLKEDIATLTSKVGSFGRTKTEEAAEVARAKANEVQGQAEAYVRDQPTTALSIAAGVGFLAGMLMSRR